MMKASNDCGDLLASTDIILTLKVAQLHIIIGIDCVLLGCNRLKLSSSMELLDSIVAIQVSMKQFFFGN